MGMDLSPGKLRGLFGGAVGVALLLALLGPFGSYAAPLPDRLLFWGATVLLGTGLSVLAALLLPSRWRQVSWPIYVTGATLVLGPVQTIFVQMLLPLIAPPETVAEVRFWDQVPEVMLLMALGTALSIGFIRWSAPAQGHGPATVPPPPPTPTTSFFDRLPPALGRDLLCLEMEDHYLRVHTARGNVLILLRLRDAVAELRTVPGAQVHKSWWVARAAVACATRSKSGWDLVLTDGRRVPVGRSFQRVLAADGWLPNGRQREERGGENHAPDLAKQPQNPSPPSGKAPSPS